MGALIEKPQKDTEKTKTLQGIIPICTSCKNIRDGKGYWNHITLSCRVYSLYLPRVCKKIYLESFQ
jgi:hypothetical protein